MTDPRPQELMVFEDLQEPGAWRVEWFDSNGAAYITMFAGRSAEERARDYHDAIAQGRLGTRITDTQQEAEVLKFRQMKTRPAFVPWQIRLPRQMNLKLAKALGLTVSRIEQECRHHDTRAG